MTVEQALTMDQPSGNEGTNVDPAEIARFEAVAHRWWDPSGDFRPLHDLNPTRTLFIAERVQLDGARVLDVGCGGGLLCESMAAQGAQVLGTDLGATAIAVARLHALETGANIKYEQIAVEALLPDHAGAFDVVTCMEMLEHVPDPAAIIAACAGLLRPGGTLFVATLNRSARSYVMAILGAEYALRLLPRGTHDYAKFIRPAELAQMLRRAGLQLSELVGVSYNPFTHLCRIGGAPDVNYLGCARLPDVSSCLSCPS